MHRNLIIAGNFNMTNVNELFDNLIQLGQHPKEMGRYGYGHGKNRAFSRRCGSEALQTDKEARPYQTRSLAPNSGKTESA